MRKTMAVIVTSRRQGSQVSGSLISASPLVPRLSPGNQHRARTLGILVLLCAMMGMVAGCTSSPPVDGVPSSVGYVEPGWMAETRQGMETFAAEYVGCMEQSGWDIEAASDGTFVPRDELTSAQIDVYRDADFACFDKLLGTVSPRTESEWRMKYSHALDTRDCLVSEGYDISDPPSEEVWVEQGLDGTGPTWIPFRQVIDQVMSGEVEMDEATYYALFGKCTQDGPTATMAW